MREVPQRAVEHHRTQDIADRDRDLIPYPPLVDAHVGTREDSGWEQPHVDHGVLESQREEHPNRDPHQHHPAQGAARGFGHDGPEAHQPVTKDAFANGGAQPIAP